MKSAVSFVVGLDLVADFPKSVVLNEAVMV